MEVYEDIEKGLLEAIEMEKGNIPLEKRENMPAPTYIVAEKEQRLIDEMVELKIQKSI